MDNVRFMYLQDPTNQYRVMTLARILITEGGEDYLQVATATNRVSGELLWHNGVYPAVIRKPVDVFNKKRGRQIAEGRLASGNSYRVWLGGRAPVVSLIDWLLSKPSESYQYADKFLPSLERRIARQALAKQGWEVVSIKFSSPIEEAYNKMYAKLETVHDNT